MNAEQDAHQGDVDVVHFRVFVHVQDLDDRFEYPEHFVYLYDYSELKF